MITRRQLFKQAVAALASGVLARFGWRAAPPLADVPFRTPCKTQLTLADFNAALSTLRSSPLPDSSCYVVSHPSRYEHLKRRLQALKAAGKISGRPTDEERVDWAYGNAALSNPNVTREMAEKAVGSRRPL